MSENVENQPIYNKKVSWIAHIIVSIVILVITAAILSSLFSSKPEARRWGGSQASPSVAVDVVDLSVDNYDVWIDSYGTAEPLTQTQLVADVTAKVIAVSPKIRAGSRFKKGDVLVQLDDRDFQVEVEVAASTAAEAEVRLLQELAEADLASQQWNKQPDNEAAKLLALRKPQVAAAEAALKAAKARLSRAQLDLERTQIRAPFDGMVLEQSIDIGQVVNPSQPIASIYSTDVVEVRLPIKTADLEHLFLPDESLNEASFPTVELIGELGTSTYQWQGRIVRSEGAFDPSTRMLFVVAQVELPFVATQERPALRVGQFLRAKIEGQQLNTVFIIPRRAVSQDNRVAVVAEGVLRKRQVQPLWTDKENVIVTAYTGLTGEQQTKLLQSSDKLILTPTANLPDGTAVKPLYDTLAEVDDGQPSRQTPSGSSASSNAVQ